MIGKNLELEWKILILACFVFIAFAWPIQTFFIERLSNTIDQSVDPHLEHILRDHLQTVHDEKRKSVLASLKRSKQWQAMIPIIIKEQQKTLLVFSFGYLLFLFAIALWSLKRLTKPLKNLALIVEKIGKGKVLNFIPSSGGALGTVEQAVVGLSQELDILREKARVQGMETAWNDIARIMVHEIKNPLTPIRLTLDRIEEKIVEGTLLPGIELEKFTSRINAQVDSLEKLVNQFRSFSRKPDVNIKEVYLSEVIQNVAEDLEPKIRTVIACTEKIISDPYLLNQIFLNIWKNSLEAGATLIDVSYRNNTDSIELLIADNGQGIKKKDIDRVWLPYITLKKGGTGLGLPVVKKLVETLGGSVRLETNRKSSQKGICVILKLQKYLKKDTYV